jgi:hypothetical protein
VLPAPTIAERFAGARRLVERIAGATGFFAWYSTPQPLSPDDPPG